jgi:(1->4)-alpha-D-glucan 1-alpha-D-glucosylmutase
VRQEDLPVRQGDPIDTTTLRALAERCSIELGYHDIWGHRHEASDRTLLALLSAMGLPVGDGPALARELARREVLPWLRVLPVAQVLRPTVEPPAIELALPLTEPERTWRWEIHEESGQVRSGTFRAAELPELERREVEGQSRVRCRLDLPEDLPLGYHRLLVAGDAGPGSETPGGAQRGDAAQALAPEGVETLLIAAPQTCYMPPALRGAGRVWGPAIQLYALRSRRNWGVGDFGDLRVLLEQCRQLGAGIVGLNPLHAIFPDQPEEASPYSPSSRIFLNTIYLEIESIPEFRESAAARELVQAPDFQAALVALRERELVDYTQVARRKRQVLEILYRHFREHHLGPGADAGETGQPRSERGRAFRDYQRRQGLDLHLTCVFAALQEHLREQDDSIWGWPAWPQKYRDPHGEAVGRWAAAHRHEVEFHAWLQFETERQLASLGHRSQELGLPVGLYADLAVSVAPGGAETWIFQDLYATAARVGAPPDDFNPEGQDWGLPPFLPDRLRAAGYSPFISTLRANMRHGGAIRIDHVMGLFRLFWVPPDQRPAAGTYVRYPLAEMLAILALESHRHRCLVVGEDLGTVPPEVREALRPLGVLSYRLFYFEKDEKGDFRAPDGFPEQAAVAVSTHDLPTLAGWWAARDIELRESLQLMPSEEVRSRQIVQRSQDRARLLVCLQREGMLPPGVPLDPARVDRLAEPIVRAIHARLAATPSRVMLVQLEDVLGQLEQVNLPGTTTQYPNWRRKLPLPLEELAADGRLTALARDLQRERQAVFGPPPPPSVATGPRSGPVLATYRLQFHAGFRFADGAHLAAYLVRLGISHIYASPYLKARAGSLHGYDIIDHGQLNPEIGSAEEYADFVAELHRRGLGQILDIVPNHMAIGSDNCWWLDVLENGPSSEYAEFFDIDWRPLKDELRGKVLLPILEDHYGRVLEQGLLQLRFLPEEGSFRVGYHEHRFPLDPSTYPRVLGHHAERLPNLLPVGDPRAQEYLSLVTALQRLPSREAGAPAAITARRRDAAVAKRQLARLVSECAPLSRFIAENVIMFNGQPGGPASRPLLADLLAVQAYRLAFWRVAMDEINYRRFFDINELAGLSTENPRVFAQTHRLILELVERGALDGLRIDHLDGLYDPAAYCRLLREEAGARLQAHRDRRAGLVGVATSLPGTRIAGEPSALGGHHPGGKVRLGATAAAAELPAPAAGEDFYIVAEKILAAHERLPESWPLDGTTGYDFAALAGGLFVDPTSERPFDRLYARFAGERPDFRELVYRSKKLIMKVALASELNVLANELDRISEADYRTRDFTLNKLREALAEVVACFPVYRTYVSPAGASEDDRLHVEWAVGVARRRSRAADLSIYDFIRDVLLLEAAQGKDEAYARAVERFAARFQQYTGPVMAKGMEDTAFYIYNRLLSLNEVGGEPDRFGVSPAVLHRTLRRRVEQWPRAMLSTSSHDSKRSEDMRARISVLSELPVEWATAVSRWSRLNRSRRRRIGGKPGRLAPDRNDEYGLYQQLIGSWPLDPGPGEHEAYVERIAAATLKAVREAKVHSSWITPEPAYEAAVTGFVRAILLDEPRNRFLADFRPFQQRIARVAVFNSLSQLLIKMAAPGVPDIYQGEEVWRYSLVDPDNRRPVDWERRRRLLDELEAYVAVMREDLPQRVQRLLERWQDGRLKLYVTWRCLQLRTAMPEVFLPGRYVPLTASGPRAEHVVAFARVGQQEVVLVVAPRLVARLGALEDVAWGRHERLWGGTALQIPHEIAALVGGRQLVDVLAGRPLELKGGTLPLESPLAGFPLALYTSRLPAGWGTD